jgi:hypothetical protein
MNKDRPLASGECSVCALYETRGALFFFVYLIFMKLISQLTQYSSKSLYLLEFQLIYFSLKIQATKSANFIQGLFFEFQKIKVNHLCSQIFCKITSLFKSDFIFSFL